MYDNARLEECSKNMAEAMRQFREAICRVMEDLAIHPTPLSHCPCANCPLLAGRAACDLAAHPTPEKNEV